MRFKPGQSGNPAGKPKGAVSKLDKEARARAADGLTPLDYMLSILRDEGQEQPARLDAAKAAAPYVHARLANIDANIHGKMGVVVEIVRFGQEKPVQGETT